MGRPESAEVLMDTARRLLTASLDSYCYIRSDIQLERGECEGFARRGLDAC